MFGGEARTAFSSEEIQCLTSILRSIDTLIPEGGEGSTGQAVELISLIPEVFVACDDAKDLVDLLCVCSPVHRLAQLAHPSMTSHPVRAASLRALAEIVTGCLRVPLLHEPLAHQLADAAAIPAVLDVVLAQTPVGDEDRTIAAEVLFVLLMQLDGARQEITKLSGAVGRLWRCALEAIGGDGARGRSLSFAMYVAGMVRALSEVDAVSELAATPTKEHPSFLELSCRILCGTVRDATLERINVLLIETLSMVISRNPQAYASLFVAETASEDAKGALSKLLAGSGDCVVRVQDALLTLFCACLKSEGALNPPRNRLGANCTCALGVAYGLACNEGFWRLGGVVQRHAMALMRASVVSTVSPFQLHHFSTTFISLFPALSEHILTAARHATADHAAEVNPDAVDAAVALCAMLAKHPGVRSAVRATVAQLPSKAADLVYACVGFLDAADDLERVALVDVLGLLLNRLSIADPETSSSTGGRSRLPDAHQSAEHFDPGTGSRELISPERLAVTGSSSYAYLCDLLQRQSEDYDKSGAPLLHCAVYRGGPVEEGVASAEVTRDLLKVAVHVTLGVPLAALQVLSRSSQKASIRSIAVPLELDEVVKMAPSAHGQGDRHRHGDPAARTSPSSSPSYVQWLDYQYRCRSRAQRGAEFKEQASPRSGRGNVPHARPEVFARPLAIYEPPSSSTVANLMAHGSYDERLSLSVMLYLPVKLSRHFNRKAKQESNMSGALRRSPVKNPVHRSTSLSWTVADLRAGDLYAFFVPFQALSVSRVREELRTLELHTKELSRALVVTPASQRGRRCLLTDLVQNVMPKVDLLVREVLLMLERHGSDEVVYQLGVIRMIDSPAVAVPRPSGHTRGAIHGTGMDCTEADVDVDGFPVDIARLSTRSFRDILHSANLLYCISHLRQRFASSE